MVQIPCFLFSLKNWLLLIPNGNERATLPCPDTSASVSKNLNLHVYCTSVFMSYFYPQSPSEMKNEINPDELYLVEKHLEKLMREHVCSEYYFCSLLQRRASSAWRTLVDAI